MNEYPPTLDNLEFDDGFTTRWPADNRIRPVVLVFPFGLLSHYLRSIVFARSLKKHYTVLFPDHPDYRSYIQKEGFGTFDCPSWNGRSVIDSLTNFNFTWLHESVAGPICQNQLKSLYRHMPLFVVGDNQPGLKIAAETAGIPLLTIMNGYMTKYYAAARDLSHRHPTYPFLRWLPAAIRNRLTAAGEKIAFRSLQTGFNHLRKQHGLRPLESYWDEMEGDYNLVCDDPVLFPQENLPGNYRIVGPLLYDEPSPATDIQPFLDPAIPTLYINVGSSGDWQKMRFLLDPHYRKYNIVTAGDHHGVLKTAACARYPFLPASSIFPYTNLLICHGGNGIVNQAMHYNVPMLFKTTFFEQEWNAMAVQRAGLGLVIDQIQDKRRLREVVDLWASTGKYIPHISGYPNRQ